MSDELIGIIRNREWVDYAREDTKHKEGVAVFLSPDYQYRERRNGHTQPRVKVFDTWDDAVKGTQEFCIERVEQ